MKRRVNNTILYGEESNMNLYNLVIVEDEDRIRAGLEKYIDWKKCGFQVVATFADGRSALEYIQKNPCDAVLTDIMMSVMSGLEMIENLKEILPAIKVVILSGYDEFSYTRRAIQYKVEDYLLKPIDEEEIYKVFAKIKEQLDTESDEIIVDIDDNIRDFECDGVIMSHNKVEFWCKALIAALNSNDLTQIERIVEELIQTYKNNEEEEVSIILKQIYSKITEEYQRRKIDVVQITKGVFDYNKIVNVNVYNAMNAVLKDAFFCLCEALSSVKMDYGSGIVSFIIEYVEKHISEELGNDVIAEKCHMHPAYLCRIFKNKTGERLLEYILRVKMKAAVKLLKSGDYTVTEISEMLGYSSNSYFSVQFKKYTGYSPTEYNIRVLEK